MPQPDQILHLQGTEDHPSVRRILLALNGSDAGCNVVAMAVDLARRLRAHVRVEDVVPQHIGYGSQWMTGDLIREASDRIDDVCSSLAFAHLAAEGEVTMARLGSRADTVVEAADAYDADLIIIGMDRIGA